MTERPGFGLYVHWPFCQAKCPYCDFNSHVSANVDQSKWRDAFRAEIARVRDLLPDRVLDTIFFGGGTPSLMEVETVATIIDEARNAWHASNTLEVTLEANPSSVEAARFEGYAKAGVNRVSIGVQSLRDTHLESLGRLHTSRDAVAAIQLAYSIFTRVSFDLIYARQNQTLNEWSDELEEALALARDHLSLYQLTIEPETAFGRRHAKGGLLGLPSQDLAADMFELTQEMTASAGFPAYEVSNHARKGEEARHNLIYWRGHDWAGIGPGAHGRFWKNGARYATSAHLAPGKWLEAVAMGSGDHEFEKLPDSEVSEEVLLMGLRLVEGVKMPETYNNSSKINDLIGDGLVWRKQDRIGATPKGRPLLNAIIREILT